MILHPGNTQDVTELKCKPPFPNLRVRLLRAPLRGLLPNPPAGQAWLWNERYAVKQDRPTLSLARSGCGAKRAGWGLGLHLPSQSLQLGCPGFLTSPKTPANSMPNTSFLPPTSSTPSPKETRVGGRGGRGRTKRGEGRRFWRKLSGGPPWCGKLHVLKSS